MAKALKIRVLGGPEVEVELGPENKGVADSILSALPIESKAHRWGDEIYFETPVEAKGDVAKEDVEVGDVAYWPEGRAICIFFGPTPISRGDKPKAYSPVYVFGRVLIDPEILRKIPEGALLKVDAA
ncbi:MAG: cyclophilin-like fold protein [Candidatus Bathyarchaeia archaeon]